MARLRLSLALGVLAIGASGCGGDRDVGPLPPRSDAVPIGVAELDALCARAKCQRVVITGADGRAVRRRPVQSSHGDGPPRR